MRLKIFMSLMVGLTLKKFDENHERKNRLKDNRKIKIK